jgi:hypothetical protein
MFVPKPFSGTNSGTLMIYGIQDQPKKALSCCVLRICVGSAPILYMLLLKLSRHRRHVDLQVSGGLSPMPSMQKKCGSCVSLSPGIVRYQL